MIVDAIVRELQEDPQWRERVPGDPARAGALLERGNGKDVIHLLPDSRRAPTVLVKYERSAEGAFRIEREARNLARLRDSGSIAGTPRQWVQLQVDGHNALALPYFAGKSLLTHLASPGVRLSRRRTTAALDAAATWLLELQRGSRTRCDDPDAFAHDHRMLDASDSSINAAIESGELLLTTQHGDFNPANILMRGRLLHVIDWEWADLPGLPLIDLFNFALRVSMLRQRLGKQRGGLPSSEDLARAFGQDRITTAFCRRWIPRFTDALEIREPQRDALFDCFARYTVGEEAGVSLDRIL